MAIAKVATAVGNRFDTAVLQQEHDSELSLDCDQSHEQMPIQHPLAVALAKVRTTRRSSGQLLLSSFEAFDSNKTTSVGVRHFHEVLSAAHVKSLNSNETAAILKRYANMHVTSSSDKAKFNYVQFCRDTVHVLSRQWLVHLS